MYTLALPALQNKDSDCSATYSKNPENLKFRITLKRGGQVPES